MIELTPKARFLASPHAKEHAELVMHPAFHAALEAALASFSLAHSVTQEQLAGARGFILVLLNLAEPPQKSDNQETLSHNLWPNPTPQPLTRAQLLERARQPRQPPQ
jgi:hypothetical protein